MLLHFARSAQLAHARPICTHIRSMKTWGKSTINLFVPPLSTHVLLATPFPHVQNTPTCLATTHPKSSEGLFTGRPTGSSDHAVQGHDPNAMRHVSMDAPPGHVAQPTGFGSLNAPTGQPNQYAQQQTGRQQSNDNAMAT